MSAHIRPRAKEPPRRGKSARQGARPKNKTNTTKETNNAAQLADFRAIVKRPATFCFKSKPLSPLAKALPPELWASIRWQAETEEP